MSRFVQAYQRAYQRPDPSTILGMANIITRQTTQRLHEACAFAPLAVDSLLHSYSFSELV